MSTVSPPLAHQTEHNSRIKRIGILLFIWFLKLFLALILIILASAGGFALGVYLRLDDIPSASKMKYYSPNERTEVYAPNGVVLKQIFGEENRRLVPLKDIPDHTIKAVLAIEDARFKTHKGVDPIGIMRAVKANMDSNKTVQGGSTITQQLVKNLYFSSERSYARKAAEAILSVQVERSYTKDQIMELYLNQIYWGHNAYGIEGASETYFGKPAKELKLHESAMLAGLIRGPENFSPYVNYPIAKQRQALALSKMVEHKFLTREQAEQAKKEPIKLYGIRRGMKYHYFTTLVMHELKQKFSKEELENGGYKVYTTLNAKYHDLANATLQKHLEKLKPRRVEQGAMVTIDVKKGHVIAIAGGTGFGKTKGSEFNRAFQAQRQTGSSFKPFVYITGFENGYRPSSVETDAPTTFQLGGGQTYTPVNYGRNHSGPMTIRSALRSSVNIVAVKVMDRVGIDKVIEMTKRLGIKSEVRPYLSSALGASEITPLEMAQAYSAFASDGILRKATTILKIEDRFGNVIVDNTNRKGKRVLGQDVARAMNSSLQSVVNGGTAAAARIPGHYVAGKTGTTSSHKDVWFMGYTPKYVTAVWVGNDTPTRMYGATGGRFCAPMWKEYMAQVLKDEKPEKFPPMIPLNRKNQLKKASFKSKKVEDKDKDKPNTTLARSSDSNAAPTNSSGLRVRRRVYVPVPKPPVPNVRSGRMSGGARPAPPGGGRRGGRMGN